MTRPNMTLCEVFAEEAAEAANQLFKQAATVVGRLLEQEDEDWSANWQPTPYILAWYRRMLSALRDNSIFGAPRTNQFYLLSHKRKTFTLVYGNPNDDNHWHDKNKVTLDLLGYRVLDRPEVPPDDPEQVRRSLEGFRNILPPEEFAKLSATALGPASASNVSGEMTVAESEDFFTWKERNRERLRTDYTSLLRRSGLTSGQYTFRRFSQALFKSGKYRINPDEMTVTESADPFTKSKVILQYRPFMLNDAWKWAWVLLPLDKSKALAHGQEDNRAKASVVARNKALELGFVVGEIDVLKPHNK